MLDIFHTLECFACNYCGFICACEAACGEESKIDPLRMFLQESFFQLVRPAVGEAAMSSNDLLAAVHDIYENAKTQKNAFKTNTAVKVLEKETEKVMTAVATWKILHMIPKT